MIKRKRNYKEATQIFQESAFLNVSLYGFIVLKFLTGFLVAKFLGPTLYGLRTLFGLVVEYAYFSHLGTFDAMGREVPYFRGRNDEKKVKLIQDNVFGVNLLFSLVVCIFMIAAAFYLHKANYDQVYIDFVLFLGAFGIADKIKRFYTVKLIVDKKAHLLSKVRILEGFTYVIACASLTYYFSLRGLFIGLLISCVIVVIYMYIKVREIPNIRISPPVILGLLKIGFPIMLIALMFILLRSVDRIIIAVLLSKQMLGYFAIGTIVSGLIFLSIADIVKVIFGPRIMEKLGKTGDINLIKNYFIEPTIIIAYFTPFLVGALYLGIHFPVKYFLAKYIAAIGVIQILVLGSFFLAIVMVPLLVCVSLNKQVNIVFLMLVAILTDAILSYSFILHGWGLEGVAIGTGISYFVLSFISLWYALKQFNVKFGEYIKLFALIYAPFLYAFCLLFILDKFAFFSTNGFWNDIFSTTLQIFIFFLMFSIVFIFIRKHMAFKKLIDSLPIPNWKTQTVLVDF